MKRERQTYIHTLNLNILKQLNFNIYISSSVIGYIKYFRLYFNNFSLKQSYIVLKFILGSYYLLFICNKHLLNYVVVLVRISEQTLYKLSVVE